MRSLDLPARPTTRSVRLALAAVALASVALASDLPRAQKNGSGPCADFQSGSGPHPYRRIDGRCEGVYRRPVSSSLELLSLTEGPVRLAPGGWSSLRISWPRLSGQALQLEARVLAPRTF
jgi:hypothetical protein